MKPKVNIVGVDDSVTIRRFVDLPKAFDLLTLDRLFMPTIDTLRKGDPFECRIPVPVPAHIIRMHGRKLKDRALKIADDMLRKPMNSINRSPPSENERKKCQDEVENCSSDDVLQKFIAAREAKEKSKCIVCNCWHMGSDESDAMWKIYANQHGLQIVSTVGRLRKALTGSYWLGKEVRKDPQHYTIAPIHYTDPINPGRLEEFYVQHPWMLKRKSFVHEEELRVFHTLQEEVCSDGVEVTVNVQELIEKIVLNPFSPPSASLPIYAALEEILKARKLKIEIVESERMNPPYFEDALTRSLKMKFLPMIFYRSLHKCWHTGLKSAKIEG